MSTQDRSSTARIIRESPLWRNDHREHRAIRELVYYRHLPPYRRDIGGDKALKD